MGESKKLWGGRFEEGLDPDAKALSYSLSFDSRLYPYDIQVNLAHCTALAAAGVISQEELDQLTQFFDDLRSTFEEKKDQYLGDDEDIHSCIERLVTESLGDLGKKIHTGKSRNDQVLTDVRLYVMDAIQTIIGELTNVRLAFFELAESHQSQLFPGFTHFQAAQPVLLAHHMMAYYEQFTRDVERFERVYVETDRCPLGSGALAGNNYALDRDLVAKELGFSGLTHNSMDAVADRDFILDFLSAAVTSMIHMSRFCEELIVWNSPMVGFVDIGDRFTTGSSIMPQKKNPDIAELIRGKVGRVQGSYTAMVTTIKGLPLTYNRDLQEDKIYLFDAVDTLSLCLRSFAKMIGTLSFNEPEIERALQFGYLNATEFADYLVSKGVPFRDSHEITGKAVLHAVAQRQPLESLSLETLQSFSSVVTEDVFDALSLSRAVEKKDIYGGTAPDRVRARIVQIKEENGW